MSLAMGRMNLERSKLTDGEGHREAGQHMGRGDTEDPEGKRDWERGREGILGEG